jgi:sugar phosphate isomerase/epimerase
MPTIALSTGSLYTYGLARTFELAAEAGFDAIEVLVDQRWDSRQPAYLRRLSQDSGWPRDSLGRLRESAALAREVGAGVVVAHLPLRLRGVQVEFFGFRRGAIVFPIPLGGEKVYRDFLLNGLATFEAEHGIIIAVENMPVKHFLGRTVDIYWLNDLRTLSQMPHLTLDTTHIGTWGSDLQAVYEQLRERITHVHLSNFDGREHRLPEGGHLPLGKFLHQLARDGYKGVVTLEVGPEVLEAEDEALVRAHLRRAVQFFRRHTSG